MLRSVLLSLSVIASLAAASHPDDHHMERPAETETVWERQADEVVAAGDAPVISGCYVWRGRADRNYKPFHQWEIQVTAGSERISDLRMRVTPMGPDLQPLLGRVGRWERLGNLGRSASIDISYKLNTSNPAAYRVELAWQGGEESFLAVDKTALPLAEGEREHQPVLLIVMPDWETKRGRTAVTFILRNDGGVEARDVVNTLRFRDDDGNVIHEHEYVPEDGTIPAGYAEAQQVVVDRVPKFATMSIATRKFEQAALDPGTFTDAPEVQVAGIAIADGQLTATVRNNTGVGVTGPEINFGLTDAQGGTLQDVVAQVGDLDHGAEAAITLDVSGIDGIGGYGLAMSYGEAGGGPTPTQAAAPGAIALDPVDGVQVSVDSVTQIDGGVQFVDRDYQSARCCVGRPGGVPQRGWPRGHHRYRTAAWRFASQRALPRCGPAPRRIGSHWTWRALVCWCGGNPVAFKHQRTKDVDRTAMDTGQLIGISASVVVGLGMAWLRWQQRRREPKPTELEDFEIFRGPLDQATVQVATLADAGVSAWLQPRTDGSVSVCIDAGQAEQVPSARPPPVRGLSRSPSQRRMPSLARRCQLACEATLSLPVQLPQTGRPVRVRWRGRAGLVAPGGDRGGCCR